MGITVTINDDPTPFNYGPMADLMKRFKSRFSKSASGFPEKYAYSPKECFVLFKELSSMEELTGDTFLCCESLKELLFSAMENNSWMYFEE